MKGNPMRVFLLLPAFNEEDALKQLIPKALGVEPPINVVVVDDGSSDNTVGVTLQFQEKDLRVQLIRHERNQGLGAAVRTLLQAAIDQADDDDVLVIMDADNTMDPSLIPKMLARLEEGCEVVIASRFAGGSEHGVPLYRRVCSQGARLAASTMLNIQNVQDYTCGYRAFRAGLARRLSELKPQFVDSNSFTSSVELLLNLSLLGPRICEVPLELRYDLKPGDSKMNVTHTIAQYFQLFWKYNRARRKSLLQQ